MDRGWLTSLFYASFLCAETGFLAPNCLFFRRRPYKRQPECLGVDSNYQANIKFQRKKREKKEANTEVMRLRALSLECASLAEKHQNTQGRKWAPKKAAGSR
jgi:hypothetical protein